MVKPTSSSSSSSKSSSRDDDSSSSSSTRSSSIYRGVRKRKWGKYVSEIRLPNSRERIWLGSYDTPEKAARAFDAALFCLRGKSAKFNFPDNPPQIHACQSLSPLQIQSVAAKFANDITSSSIQQQPPKIHVDVDVDVDVGAYTSPPSPEYSSSSAAAATATDGLVPIHDINDLTMDWSFLDLLSAVPGSVSSSSINYESVDFSDFTDDFPTDFFPPPPSPLEAASADYVDDNGCTQVNFPYYHHHHQQESFLWNF